MTMMCPNCGNREFREVWATEIQAQRECNACGIVYLVDIEDDLAPEHQAGAPYSSELVAESQVEE